VCARTRGVCVSTRHFPIPDTLSRRRLRGRQDGEPHFQRARSVSTRLVNAQRKPPKGSVRSPHSAAGAQVPLSAPDIPKRLDEKWPSGLGAWQAVSAGFGFSLGRKPKGGAARNRLPFNSQYPFPRLTYVNPKAEPVETDSHLTPNTLFRGLLTVPDDATRAVN